jgi:sialate O-acetylesterase
MTHRRALILLIAATLLPALFSPSFSQDRRRLISLRGEWLFEIGDVKSGEDPKLNDEKWEAIHVPSHWEDEGYPGYDGFAWYRKHITLKSEWKDRVLYLHMGKIDDADEVYVNGHFIGFTGYFPPHYITAYDQYREYPLPQWCLNYSGDNVIAVRVYDQEQGGGITTDEIGIYEQRDPLYPRQSLAGNWKFSQGDDFRWKEPGYNDGEWRTIAVPMFWETQGMKDYDGFGWYRYKFRPEQSLDGQKVVLLVGKIDDLDEVYLNGELVGKTGTMRSRGRSDASDEYLELRAYTLPKGGLKFGEDNVLAVRVFDNMFHGGIYDGPIGLISRDDFKQWEERNKDKKGWFLWELRKWFR